MAGQLSFPNKDSVKCTFVQLVYHRKIATINNNKNNNNFINKLEKIIIIRKLMDKVKLSRQN